MDKINNRILYIAFISFVVSIVIAYLSSWALGKYDNDQTALEYKFATAGAAIAPIIIIGAIGLLFYYQLYGAKLSGGESGSGSSSGSDSGSGIRRLFSF